MTDSLTTLLDTTRQMDSLRSEMTRLADVRTGIVLRLRNDGMTYREIGTHLSVTPQAVEKMARRGT